MAATMTLPDGSSFAPEPDTPRRMLGFDVEPGIALDVVSRVHDALRAWRRSGRVRAPMCTLELRAEGDRRFARRQASRAGERWVVDGRLAGLTPSRGSIVVLAWDWQWGGFRHRCEVPVGSVVRIEVEDV